MPRRRPLAAALLVTAVALAVAMLGSSPAVAGTPAAARTDPAQAADEPPTVEPQTDEPPTVDPECPVGLACRFTPAVYAQTDPGDPNAYGNYDPADRPDDGDGIRYIVIHNTEEGYDSAIARFQDLHRGVSAHYLIRSSDGQVTQLVYTGDIAYHAGNYWFNMHSIGIEPEGVLVDGARWYTEEMYQASARLVRYLAARYHIPLDREHILGHDELPGLTQAIPVYGAAFPEAAAYPPTIPVTRRRAVAVHDPRRAGLPRRGAKLWDYYYARFDGADVPDNHTLVVGNRRLVEISFNHRRAFVDAADVLVLR